MREKQELHFQQQLELAHLQAELNEAEAELSTEFSNIEFTNQTELTITSCVKMVSTINLLMIILPVMIFLMLTNL